MFVHVYALAASTYISTQQKNLLAWRVINDFHYHLRGMSISTYLLLLKSIYELTTQKDIISECSIRFIQSHIICIGSANMITVVKFYTQPLKKPFTTSRIIEDTIIVSISTREQGSHYYYNCPVVVHTFLLSVELFLICTSIIEKLSHLVIQYIIISISISISSQSSSMVLKTILNIPNKTCIIKYK